MTVVYLAQVNQPKNTERESVVTRIQGDRKCKLPGFYRAKHCVDCAVLLQQVVGPSVRDADVPWPIVGLV